LANGLGHAIQNPDNNVGNGEMRSFNDMIDGHRRFKRDSYAADLERYRRLAAEGQSPKVMIIGCCDSRVDPAAIFDAGPGELFVTRNVANIVPPYQPDRGHHGTSAAIEFAVGTLGVEHILVLGHGACGGIKALLEGIGDNGAEDGRLIARWMSIAAPVCDRVRAAHPDAPPAVLQEVLEKAAVVQSLDNLRGFPFVAEAMEKRRLQLHGGWFSIEAGALELLDPATAQFVAVAV
jgi:carbonic anhydrase